jgi:glutamate-1-semialdehyde 2,1-aminomutase
MVRSLASLHEEFTAKNPKSRAQWERGKATMPGGIIKGAYWRAPFPFYVDKAEGCYLTDIDGNTFVDFANHHSAMIVGHSHPDVVAAVQREVERGFGLGNPTELEAEISQEIVSRFPSIEKVRFTNSGTESSLHATRLIRAKTGKPKIAKFEGAYHGSHDALEHSVATPLDKAGPADSPAVMPGHKGMSRGSQDEVVMLPYNDRESVELILREHQDEVAGVFFDGKPGMMEIPDDFAHFLRDITKELGMYLVVDEVVGYRAGRAGYQGKAGIDPDLTIFGKIVGGGMPVGAMGGKSELMDMLDNTGAPSGISQSGTFSGNNFTLAAGLATLRALTDEVYDHLESLAVRTQSGMKRVFNDAGIPNQVLAAGSVVNPFFTDKPVRDYRSFTNHDDELLGRISLGTHLKGYSLGSTPMTIMLSSPMTNEHIDGLVNALEEVIAEED